MAIDDLQGAIKAELTGYFHTGHIGTSDRTISINGGSAVDLPSPEMPDGLRKECYFTQIFGRPSVAVELADLKEGENRFRFSVGPQICHGFDWPCYGFHNITVRIYYNNSKPHPSGEIVYPLSGQVISNDDLPIKIGTLRTDASIASVDIVGFYYDYPFEGSGRYQDWHYMIDEYGRWFGFIDRSKNSPYHETWDLRWLPDQPEPMKLTVQITDTNGVSYMTPAVDNLTLERRSRSVKLYETVELPENFKVRVGEIMQSRFQPITNDLSRANAARLASITAVGHLEGKYSSSCGINGTRIKQYRNLPDLHTDFFTTRLSPSIPRFCGKG